MAKRQKEKTEEQKRIDALERRAYNLQKIRDEYISEPTCLYQVGDRVQRGAITESYVTAILDDGKIYELHQIHMANHYGKIVREEGDVYVAWHDLTPYHPKEEWEKVEQLREINDLRIQYYNSSVTSILNRHYHFGINYDPDYQRGNVWLLGDKVSLIDSIFANVEIGKFAFISLPFKLNSPAYEVLDGKQRVRALIDFYEGRFKVSGKFYRDLHPYDRNHFDGFPIAIGDIREEVTDLQKYKYFLKLNTCGKPQDKDHILKVGKLYIEACKNESKKG